MLYQLILFCIFICVVNSQRLVSGICPSINTENDFDVYKFYGHWIETERTPSIFDFVLRCMEVDYSNEKDGTLGINIKGVSFAGLPILIKGDGVIHDTFKNGHYNVRYAFGVPFQGTVLSVIDTDYKEYAVLYSCTNSLFPRLLHSEHIWILTRNGNLSNPSRQNIYTRLDQLKINRNGLTLSDRKNCPASVSNLIIREEDVKKLTNITRNVNETVNSVPREEFFEPPFNFTSNKTLNLTSSDTVLETPVLKNKIN